jgi:hypothetical protein
MELVVCLLNSIHHDGVWRERMYASKRTFPWNSALVGDECLASRLGRFTPRERFSSSYFIWGWVEPRAGLDCLEKRSLLNPKLRGFRAVVSLLR